MSAFTDVTSGLPLASRICARFCGWVTTASREPSVSSGKITEGFHWIFQLLPLRTRCMTLRYVQGSPFSPRSILTLNWAS